MRIKEAKEGKRGNQRHPRSWPGLILSGEDDGLRGRREEPCNMEYTLGDGPPKPLQGLPNHRATALMLLRTEVIGLNAWLVSVRVPGVLSYCYCGWHAKTVRHIVRNS